MCCSYIFIYEPDDCCSHNDWSTLHTTERALWPSWTHNNCIRSKVVGKLTSGSVTILTTLRRAWLCCPRKPAQWVISWRGYSPRRYQSLRAREKESPWNFVIVFCKSGLLPRYRGRTMVYKHIYAPVVRRLLSMLKSFLIMVGCTAFLSKSVIDSASS